MKNRIAILIPCYNESKTIKKVIIDFREQLPEAEIYVFDNNSTDGSGDIARENGAIVIKEKKQGKGHVVASMLKNVSADYYIMVDGDDTYPADYCHTLLQPLYEEKADMVVGQRLSDYEDNAFRALHFMGNKLICGLINSIFNSSLKDPLSGYRAFTDEVAQRIPVVAGGFDIETELTLQMLYRRLIIEEVVIPYRARPDGSESKLSTFRDGFKIFFKIFLILRSYKPLTFFGSIAIVSEIISLGSGLTMLINHLEHGKEIGLFLPILCACSFVIGIFFIAIGSMLNLLNFRLLEISSVLEKQIYRSTLKDE